MMGLLGLILFCQCFLCCRKHCCKKKQSVKRAAARAKNGMVPSGVDQEEEDDGSQIEAADVGSKYKQAKTKSTISTPKNDDDDDDDEERNQDVEEVKQEKGKKAKNNEKPVDSQVREGKKKQKSDNIDSRA